MLNNIALNSLSGTTYVFTNYHFLCSKINSLKFKCMIAFISSYDKNVKKTLIPLDFKLLRKLKVCLDKTISLLIDDIKTEDNIL